MSPGPPAIVGIHDGPGDNAGRSCIEIGALAALGALEDAGLPLSAIDGILAGYAWEEPSLMFASQLGDYLGVTPAYVDTVCLGGASPAMMVARAARAITQGLAEVVVLIAASNRASKVGRAGAIAALRDVLSPEFEVPYGAFIPPVYALTATRYMHEWGTTAEQLAAVAVTQREHAALHPRAALRRPLTTAEVLASPIIASPLHLFDCCLVTDFGGAAVVTTADRARGLGQRFVQILGTAEAHDRLSTAELADMTTHGARISGPLALSRAGVAIEDVDFAELYDSFTITVLSTLEDIGFCEKGQAGSLAQAGAFRLGSTLPINTNGGMLSYRTGGISHIIEAVEQLRGTAQGGKVPDPKVGLVHGIGGTLSSHCTLVLGSDQR